MTTMLFLRKCLVPFKAVSPFPALALSADIYIYFKPDLCDQFIIRTSYFILVNVINIYSAAQK